MEVIVKQLFSKVLIEDSGDTTFVPGSIVKHEEFVRTNTIMTDSNKRPATGERLVL